MIVGDARHRGADHRERRWRGAGLGLGVPTVLIDENRATSNATNDSDLGAGGRADKPRLHHVHLGLDRRAKGCVDREPLGRAPGPRADYATFGPDRVFLQLAPLAFDASTFEIWGALLHGGRLVLAPTGRPIWPLWNG